MKFESFIPPKEVIDTVYYTYQGQVKQMNANLLGGVILENPDNGMCICASGLMDALLFPNHYSPFYKKEEFIIKNLSFEI